MLAIHRRNGWHKGRPLQTLTDELLNGVTTLDDVPPLVGVSSGSFQPPTQPPVWPHSLYFSVTGYGLLPLHIFAGCWQGVLSIYSIWDRTGRLERIHVENLIVFPYAFSEWFLIAKSCSCFEFPLIFIATSSANQSSERGRLKLEETM